MKQLLVLVIALLSFTASFAGNFDITFKVKGIQDDYAVLAHYYADKKYVVDTVRFNAQNIGKLEGEKDINPGVYLLAFPALKFRYFEFIINEPSFTIETDTTDFLDNMKISNSTENKLFYKDQSNMIASTKAALELQDQLEGLEEDSKAYKKIKNEITDLSSKTFKIREDIIENYPNTLYTSILLGMQDVKIPNEIDSTQEYGYFKEHYFDNISFENDNIIRTPVFYKKVMDYMDKYTLQQPDSIISSCDFIIEKSMANEDFYQYAVTTLLNKYAKSKIMGQERVYIHLLEKYYLSGKTPWVDEATLTKFQKRVQAMKPTLIGKTAPEIKMTGLNNEIVSLQKTVIQNDYTIIAWWNSTCGHCKTEMPILASTYDSLVQKFDSKIAVFAVSTEHELGDWKKFIEAKQLNKQGWFHCLDLTNTNPAQAWYDVNSTPLVMVVDSRGKILAKRIAIANIEGLIEHDTNMKQKKN